jgi:hypothetical protein
MASGVSLLPFRPRRHWFSFIVQVLEARTQGIGLNAACRAFANAKNTLLLWERRLAGCEGILLAYARTHAFS